INCEDIGIWHSSAHVRGENSNQFLLRNGTPRSSFFSDTMGGARSCWLCYARRLQVDGAADTLSFDRSPACLPNLVRPMHRGQNLALFSKPLMKIKNFLALFRK